MKVALLLCTFALLCAIVLATETVPSSKNIITFGDYRVQIVQHFNSLLSISCTDMRSKDKFEATSVALQNSTFEGLMLALQQKDKDHYKASMKTVTNKTQEAGNPNLGYLYLTLIFTFPAMKPTQEVIVIPQIVMDDVAKLKLSIEELSDKLQQVMSWNQDFKVHETMYIEKRGQYLRLLGNITFNIDPYEGIQRTLSSNVLSFWENPSNYFFMFHGVAPDFGQPIAINFTCGKYVPRTNYVSEFSHFEEPKYLHTLHQNGSLSLIVEKGWFVQNRLIFEIVESSVNLVSSWKTLASGDETYQKARVGFTSANLNCYVHDRDRGKVTFHVRPFTVFASLNQRKERS